MQNVGPLGQSLSCACGKVRLDIYAEPIVAMTCNCKSCQAAGRQLQALPAATAILNASGGTPYVLFRKDRVQCVSGATLLDEHRLVPTSPTPRSLFILRLIATWAKMGFRTPRIQFIRGQTHVVAA